MNCKKYNDIVNGLQLEPTHIKSIAIHKIGVYRNKHVVVILSQTPQRYTGSAPLIQTVVGNEVEPSCMKLTKQIIMHSLYVTGIANYEKIAYRRNAGCACGCSPGFFSENLEANFNIAVYFYDTEDEMEEMLQQLK